MLSNNTEEEKKLQGQFCMACVVFNKRIYYFCSVFGGY